MELIYVAAAIMMGVVLTVMASVVTDITARRQGAVKIR